MPYTTSEMASACRTTERGIRLWEINGLLGDVPRGENGERVFDEDHLSRAKVVSAAVMAGMSHGEIRAAHDVTLLSAVEGARSFMKKAIANLPREFDL